MSTPTLRGSIALRPGNRITVERGGSASNDPYATVDFHEVDGSTALSLLTVFIDHACLDQVIFELTTYRDEQEAAAQVEQVANAAGIAARCAAIASHAKAVL